MINLSGDFMDAEFERGLNRGIDGISKYSAIGGTGLVALAGAAIGGPVGWTAAVVAGAGALAMSSIK